MNAKLLGLIGSIAVFMAACSNTCDVDSQGGAVTPGTAADFKQNVPDRVFFDFDSAKLSDAAKKRLDAQVGWFRTYSSTKATVEGHADVRGTSEYNMALGSSRANSVSEYYEKSGLDKTRFTVISYGKERPEDTGTTEEAHAKNRRSVTIVEE